MPDVAPKETKKPLGPRQFNVVSKVSADDIDLVALAYPPLVLALKVTSLNPLVQALAKSIPAAVSAPKWVIAKALLTVDRAVVPVLSVVTGVPPLVLEIVVILGVAPDNPLYSARYTLPFSAEANVHALVVSVPSDTL